MKVRAIDVYIVASGIFIALFLLTKAFAADLAPPYRQNLTIVPLPRLPNPAAIPAPTSRTSESCLTNDVEPKAGQTLQADTTCPTGLRWKYQK